MKFNLSKYEKIAELFKFILKYWNSNLITATAEQLEHPLGGTTSHEEKWDISPEEFVEDIKHLGPAFVKLGQLLSTRPDLLPEPFLKALTELQDDVEEVRFEEVEQIFYEEIGVRISKAFSSFNETPLASASIGQVHEAVLRSGKKVAVKIQRPGVRTRFVEDLDILMTLAKQAEKHSETARNFSIYDIIEELRYTFLQELDYQKEARNLILLKENLKEFRHLFIPATFPDFCSQRVLTMDFIEGVKITQISPLKQQELGSLKEQLAGDFIRAYLKQIIIDGIAHADPHPGNVYLTGENKLAMMDLGMVARFDYELQQNILKLMISLSSGNGSDVADLLLKMSHYDEETAHPERFRKKVVRKILETKNNPAKQFNTGREILEINSLAALEQIKLPVEFSLLGKILLNMDQIIVFLSPEHDIQATVINYVNDLLQKQLLHDLKSGNVLQTMLQSKELLENMPERLNSITEQLARNKFKIKVDAFDERRFILAFQKVANRISTSLIVAALILGAAMLMQVPTTWTILGYPAFAILLFILAASIALYLVYQVLFTDEDDLHP